MRWKRVLSLSLAMTAVAIVLVGAVPSWHWIEAQLQERSERPDPVIASPEETREMLGVAITTLQLGGAPSQPPGHGKSAATSPSKVLLIADRSMCFDSIPESDCSGYGEKILYPELEGVAPIKFRRELVAANAAPVELVAHGIPGTRVEASGEIKSVFENGFWEDFYERYPGTAGFVRVSRPVLSADRERALLYLSHHCGGVCGSGHVLLLVRSGAQWRVEIDERIWIS